MVPSPPQPAPPAVPVSRPTNTLAIVSLVAGIGSFFAHIVPGVGGLTVAIIAVITGFMARSQIKRTGEGGMGLATAGIIIGFIHLALLILAIFAFVIIFILFLGGLAIWAHSSTSPTPNT